MSEEFPGIKAYGAEAAQVVMDQAKARAAAVGDKEAELANDPNTSSNAQMEAGQDATAAYEELDNARRAVANGVGNVIGQAQIEVEKPQQK
jgi:hypothetical protein